MKGVILMHLNEMLKRTIQDQLKHKSALAPFDVNKLINLINKIEHQRRELKLATSQIEVLLDNTIVGLTDESISEARNAVLSLLNTYKDRLIAIEKNPEGVKSIEHKTDYFYTNLIYFFVNLHGSNNKSRIDPYNTSNTQVYTSLQKDLESIIKKSPIEQNINTQATIDEASNHLSLFTPVKKEARSIRGTDEAPTIEDEEKRRIIKEKNLALWIHSNNAGILSRARKFIKICETCKEYLNYNSVIKEKISKIDIHIKKELHNGGHMDRMAMINNTKLIQYRNALLKLNQAHQNLTVSIARFYSILDNINENENIIFFAQHSFFNHLSLCSNFAYSRYLSMYVSMATIMALKQYIPSPYYYVLYISMGSMIIESTIRMYHYILQTNKFPNQVKWLSKEQKNNSDNDSNTILICIKNSWIGRIIHTPSHILNNEFDFLRAIFPALLISVVWLIDPELIIIFTPFIQNPILFQSLWMILNILNNYATFSEKNEIGIQLPEAIDTENAVNAIEKHRKLACSQENMIIQQSFEHYAHTLSMFNRQEQGKKIITTSAATEDNTAESQLKESYSSLHAILGVFGANELKKSISTMKK